jgi:hypothetical protein
MNLHFLSAVLLNGALGCRGNAMTALSALKIALVVFGAAFLLIYPLAIIWPSGWAWHSGPAYSNDYYMMIVGVYAVLGLFLIAAARDPLSNRSLIWFTVVSSLVHGSIMATQSFGMTEGMNHMGHLMGDVPALFAIAAILGVLLWQAKAPAKN